MISCASLRRDCTTELWLQSAESSAISPEPVVFCVETGDGPESAVCPEVWVSGLAFVCIGLLASVARQTAAIPFARLRQETTNGGKFLREISLEIRTSLRKFANSPRRHGAVSRNQNSRRFSRMIADKNHWAENRVKRTRILIQDQAPVLNRVFAVAFFGANVDQSKF